MRNQKTPGTFSSLRPKKSFTCVLAIRMAIPLVKPITIGIAILIASTQVKDFNQDGDTVGEADYNRPRNIFHRRSHAGESHHDENQSGHHGAHEQAIDAMSRDDSSNDDDEGSGRTTDLSCRSSKRGDDKPGDDRAVDSRLWR